MNLPGAFQLAASRNRTKTALFWGETEFTYEQFWRQTAWVSNELKNRFGVKPGERVALWLKNCPQFVPALFGVLETGAVVAPVNNFLKPDEASYILGDAEIQVIITDQAMKENTDRLSQLRPGLRFLFIEEIPDLPAEAPIESHCPRQESDLAVIIYTSGTTGRPKGAMLSHGNLLHNVNSCRQVLEAVEGDRIVVLLPMFHSFMLCVGIMLPMIVGGTIILIKSIHPPKNILMEIMQRQATVLPAIPQFFRSLSHPSVPATLPLRLCISGGAPLPAEILKEFSQKFSQPLLEGYGLSEASPVVSFNPLKGPWKAGSIGRPILNVEMSIQGENGEMLGDDQTGEICVRGGNVMQGYWRQPEESAKSLRNGWLLTGDIGHRDSEGYYFITDRKKDMLLVNGINVYPREIEEILYQFPGVREAAVIGQPDTRRGEMPIAFISANEGATVDTKALLQFVKEKLADYKVPRKVFILPALPRNATGKILKTALREQAEREKL